MKPTFVINNGNGISNENNAGPNPNQAAVGYKELEMMEQMAQKYKGQGKGQNPQNIAGPQSFQGASRQNAQGGIISSQSAGVHERLSSQFNIPQSQLIGYMG